MYKSYRQISSCAYPKDSITDNTKYIQTKDEMMKFYPSKYKAGELEKEVQFLYKAGTPQTIRSYRYDPLSTERGDIGQIIPYTFIKAEADASQEVKDLGEIKTELKEGYRGATCGISSGTCGASSGASSGTCGATCGESDKLFAILDPKFNLREVSKHLILLEDHLFHEGKRCQDCISKHFLTIEAFLDEAVTLDKKGEYRDMVNETLKQLRSIIKDFSQRREYLTDEEYCQIAQQLRTLRKPLCVMTFGFC
jgi:hypothetical protein